MIFIPANHLPIIGDALLQYAGFLAAEEKKEYSDVLDFEYHDSSDSKWLDELEECVRSTPYHQPVWIIVTMSAKGALARHALDLHLERRPRLWKQLTAVFTVASSRFET